MRGELRGGVGVLAPKPANLTFEQAAAIGSSDPVPFSSELWGRLVRDRLDYVAPMAQAIVDAVT